MSQVLTRDDVFLSEPRTFRPIPGIVRCAFTVVTVAGRRYEMMTIESWLIKATPRYFRPRKPWSSKTAPTPNA